MIKRLVLTGAALAVLAAPSAVEGQEFCFSAIGATCVTFNGIAWSPGDPAATGSFALNSYTGGLLPTSVLVFWFDGTSEWAAGCDVPITGFGTTYSFSNTCDFGGATAPLALEQIEIGAFTGISAEIGGAIFDCIREPTPGGGVISSNGRSSVQYASMFALFQVIPDCVARSVSVPAPAAALLSFGGLLGLLGAAMRRREDDFEGVA